MRLEISKRGKQRKKLDFLMAYVEFYEMIWCAISLSLFLSPFPSSTHTAPRFVQYIQEEKKFIHFDINLLILDHSWLNEIDIHTQTTTKRSHSTLNKKSINLEEIMDKEKISIWTLRSNFFFQIECRRREEKTCRVRREMVFDWIFYEIFMSHRNVKTQSL